MARCGTCSAWLAGSGGQGACLLKPGVRAAAQMIADGAGKASTEELAMALHIVEYGGAPINKEACERYVAAPGMGGEGSVKDWVRIALHGKGVDVYELAPEGAHEFKPDLYIASADAYLKVLPCWTPDYSTPRYGLDGTTAAQMRDFINDNHLYERDEARQSVSCRFGVVSGTGTIYGIHPDVDGWIENGETVWEEQTPDTLYLPSEDFSLARCGVCGGWWLMSETGSYTCPYCGAHDGDHHLTARVRNAFDTANTGARTSDILTKEPAR